MFLSGGFIFPHAMTEDDDIVKHDADKEGNKDQMSSVLGSCRIPVGRTLTPTTPNVPGA